MKDLKIVLVEDDSWYAELLKHHLSLNPDYEVSIALNAKQCLDELHKKPGIICLDFDLPDMKGDLVLEQIHAYDPSIPVIIISGQENMSVAVNFLKAGAKDYIIKNKDTKEALWNAILKLRENIELKKEVEELKVQLEQKHSFEKSIIGQSAAIKKTFSLVEKAIASSISISITGETGTGKEVFAKAIHYNSERKKKPFVAVNMAAIPSELIESELFGYEKGAFTGANNRKIGKFEEAGDGTLFLDEIAELNLHLQTKILRALQEREIVRVGGNERIKWNARLITATHKNLVDEVKKGTFREDLFYRVMGLPINLPPLRERGQDILVLARFFAENFAKENKLKVLNFSKAATAKLMQYTFPGNVRELKAVIELACVMSNGIELTEEDINFYKVNSDDLFTGEEKSLREYNLDIVHFFLKKYNNDVLEVARRLSMGKTTIYTMLKQQNASFT
ncbi:regulator [Sphingobacteriaceae bacterium]|nr:regulator [Sphingobacteriaceae bacterium]